VRRIFCVKRVGHLGTLDPGAAGVLPVCVGRAAKLFDYLVDKEKTYIAELAFGCSTDTQDASGQVLQRSDARVTAAMLEETLPAFCGEITQLAPLYSAVRVDGKKLYQLARAGVEAPEKIRKVQIHGLRLLQELSPNRFLIRIECSKGTYVRTLCHDIGAALGVPAHMAFLLRTRSGNFELSQSFTIAELREMKESGSLIRSVIPIDTAIKHVLKELDMSALSSKGKQHLMNGAAVLADAKDGKYRIYVDQDFWGIGLVEKGMLHIELNLILEPGRN